MPAIIDTDPGIDDAIAILYALRHPEIDIIGMTTVAGNIGLSVTTPNALKIASLAQVPTPVHAGAPAPMGREPRPEIGIHGNDGLGGVPLPDPDTDMASNDAVTYLAETLMAAPDKTIDLYCLAPLTNIANLILSAPEAAQRIRHVIAMGGAVDEPGNMGRGEFNLAHDPDAAEIVLHAGLDLILIPLDATRQFRADAAYLTALRATGKAPAITSADLIDAYFVQTEHQAKGSESRPLHDPCVPLYALHSDLFRIETRHLQVDHDGALIEGPHPIRVAMGVEANALRARLLDGLAC